MIFMVKTLLLLFVLFLKEPRLHQYFNNKCKITHIFSSIRFALFLQLSWFLSSVKFLESKTITNLPKFISSYKNCINSMLWLIWIKFAPIQYFKYSNGWHILFSWHMWMWMFNTKTTHNFMQNYSMIITWI